MTPVSSSFPFNLVSYTRVFQPNIFSLKNLCVGLGVGVLIVGDKVNTIKGLT